MSLSRTPKLDRNLKAFDWLPFDRWTPNYLFNDYYLSGGQMCKVCDEIVSVNDQAAHCKHHIKQEKQRRNEVKEEAAVERIKNLDTETVLTYLSEHPKGQTVAGIATATKKNINDVYKEIKVLLGQGKVEVVGQHKIPGKRGKPAAIYGKKEVAN